MAQDEKMLVPVEPTDTMIEAAVDAFPRSHPSVFPIIYRAMLSAAPAQPAAVEGVWDEAVALRQARYVLKELHAKDGTCGYDKLAEACERAADRVQWEPADDALMVAVAVKALERIEKRTTPHPDDTISDTAKDALKANVIARQALAALKAEKK